MADVAKGRTPSGVSTQSVRTAETGDKPAVQENRDRPDFLSEGTRAELEQNGWALDPRNGRKIVGTGPDDMRYEDPDAAVQASDVAARVGATRATNEHTNK